jgi:hypothetical protein
MYVAPLSFAGNRLTHTFYCTGTTNCQIIQAKIGGTPVAVVDTPGFDDTRRSDAEVLHEITEFLVAQYALGIKLRGIVYLHRITDIRMQGSALRYFEMFRRLCGDHALDNVALVTTMWGRLKEEAEGLQREQELIDDFWDPMIELGSYVTPFDGSKEAAEGIVALLVGKEEVVLKIQHELVDERKTPEQTSAGSYITSKVDARLVENTKLVGELTEQLAKAERDRNVRGKASLELRKTKAQLELSRERKGRESLKQNVTQQVEEKIKKSGKQRWVTGIQIFASVMGISISVIGNLILPLLGVC